MSLAHPVGTRQTAIAPVIAVPLTDLLDEHTAREGVDAIPKRTMLLLQISVCRPDEGIETSVLPREDRGTQSRIEAFEHDKGRAMGTEVAPAQPGGIRLVRQRFGAKGDGHHVTTSRLIQGDQFQAQRESCLLLTHREIKKGLSAWLWVIRQGKALRILLPDGGVDRMMGMAGGRGMPCPVGDKQGAPLRRVQGSSLCLRLEDDLFQHSTRDVIENRIERGVIQGKADAEEVGKIGADRAAFLPEAV